MNTNQTNKIQTNTNQTNQIQTNTNQTNQIQTNTIQANMIQTNTNQTNKIQTNTNQTNQIQTNTNQTNQIQTNTNQTNTNQTNKIQTNIIQTNKIQTNIIQIKQESELVGEIAFLIQKEFPYSKMNEKKLGKRLGNKKIQCHCLIEKELIGFAELEKIKDAMRLNAIVVKEKFRKNGFGNKLLEFSENIAEKNNAKKVFLMVEPENFAAKKLYEKRNFALQGIVFDKKLGKEVEHWEKTFF